MITVKILKLKILIVFLFSILFVKLIYLQILKGHYFSNVASEQQEKFLSVYGKRGEILDSRSRVLAMDRNVYSIFINPKQVSAKEKTAKLISNVLSLDMQDVLDKLYRNCFFVWLKRGVEREVAVSYLEKLKIQGIGMKTERRRIYPQDNLAAHVLGAVDIDNYGISGVELHYEDILKGTPGYVISLGDGKNLYLDGLSKTYMAPKNGKTIVLTIDQVLQHYAEEEAERLLKEHKAKKVSIVVMDPQQGDILALVNRPAYNPNAVKKEDVENMRNFAISDLMEPGSVFKVITASALLDLGLVKLDDMVYCENGAYKIGRRTLHDHHPYAWLDFKSVIVNSSNIGVAKSVALIDKYSMYDYLKLFGIGDMTGIDLPGETCGILREPEKWSDYSKASIAIGQEVAVTPLSLASMLSVIANGGYLVKPHILKEVRDENGITIDMVTSKAGDRVLDAEVIEKMKEILKSVVDNGTGKNAKSNIYSACGKTGTSQKADLVNGGYYSNKYVASFIGFLPIKEPRMVVVITVDEPHPYYYGGTVCAPAFKKFAEKAILYLTVSQEDRRVDNEIRKNFIWN